LLPASVALTCDIALLSLPEEFSALQYYWWFFLLFALLGSSVAQMVLNAFKDGSFQFLDTLQSVAATIPSQVSSNWANWIILKAMVSWFDWI
jgi:hypothetical protein